tara:strand:- start:843 stop:1004 length:162 start_codon:yes stop_codon:yes gene_type:complete
MNINEKEGVIFGTWDEREEMLKKMKELVYRKKNAQIIARIEELMQQINQQGSK